MLLFSHPAPTGPVRHTASALCRAGLLGEFWTLCGQRAKLLARPRIAAAAPAPAVACAAGPDRLPAWDEAMEYAEIDGDPSAQPHAVASAALDHKMRTRLSREKFDGVYGYEDAAEETFRAAHRLDLLRVYDVPLGNWRGSHPILTEEAAREPEWAPTLGPVVDPSIGLGKVQAELNEADLVFVGSSFGLETLEQTAELPGVVAIASPGAPPPPFEADGCHPQDDRTETLRVLYAGRLSQRAGLSYAFRACRELGSGVALTVIAPPPVVPCPPLRRELDRVRWLATASMEVVRREMASADLFLVPAIYDTSSELLLQALAAGLPVIATPHSAAPDLIRDGREGYIVPIRSPDAIMAKLELLRTDPELRAEMSRQAHRRAREHSWRRYEEIVAASVATALAQRSAGLTV